MGLAALVFGLCLLGMGLYGYVGQGAVTMYRRIPIGPFVNIVYSEVPYGLGFTALGLAMILKTGTLSDVLALAGLGCMAVGVILGFWHPYADRPHWLRDAWGD
ncbi:MAG: hypothetical protein E6I61_16530 [Chloroflexi bacterium]|nr:MAG: hypothetical protein E6I61_16530 [Chloroflexota bacterium]